MTFMLGFASFFAVLLSSSFAAWLMAGLIFIFLLCSILDWGVA